MNKRQKHIIPFLKSRAIIQALLNQMSALADDHFGIDPDDISEHHTRFLNDLEARLEVVAERMGIDTSEIIEGDEL